MAFSLHKSSPPLLTADDNETHVTPLLGHNYGSRFSQDLYFGVNHMNVISYGVAVSRTLHKMITF